MRRLTVFALPLLLTQILSAQVITTIAGTSWTFPSNSLPALNAPLGAISGVAIDSHGNIFVADHSNSLILEITQGGTLSVYAGNGQLGHSGDNGPAINASINPTDVAVDSKGNLYIQDQAYIRIVTPAGVISTIAGNGTYSFSGEGVLATSASISALSGMITDSAGNLYFADTLNNCVRKISNGIITTYAGKCGSVGYSGDGKAAVAGQLSQPAGLAFDSFGNLYIGDSGNRVVREVSTVGTISTVVGPAQFASPSNLAMDAKANLYIADSAANRVFQYSFKTSVLSNYAGTGAVAGAFSGDGAAALNARLNNPTGLAVDPGGNLYIADSGNYRLREVAPTPLTISTVAGNGLFRFAGDNGQAINAQLNSPMGTALDSAGNLYFADTDNDVIRKVTTTTGTITTVAGGGLVTYPAGDNGPAVSASLSGPTDVALDGAGNLYIADAGNSVIRKVVLATGTITTVAGGGLNSGNNISAVSENLLDPVAVAVDAGGNLYIADFSCGKVYEVKGGTISVFAGQPTCYQGYVGDNGPAVGAGLNSPEGLAFDSAGNLYIADNGNNAVRKINTSGMISTVMAASSGLFEPHAVAVDSSGNLYVADFNKIREMSASGTIQVIAGGGPPNTLGDGGAPTAADIDSPEGLTVDGSGNVLIADTGNGRIRKVIGSVATVGGGGSGGGGGTTAPPPAYLISASSLTFAQSATGAIVPPQTVNLTPTANGATAAVNGLQFSVVTDTGSSAWLKLNITAGSMPASLVVSANPGALAAGTYDGTITISAQGTANPTAVVNVTLTVPQPPPTAVLGVDTQGITFIAAPNSGLLTNQFHVLNTGGGTLTFTATVTSAGGAWLSITPTSGPVTPDGPVAVTATATTASLSPGTYSGSIVVSAGLGTPIAVPVTLTVNGPTATMLISEAAMTFTAISGGAAPLPHNFGILNTGACPNGATACPMDWEASASTLVNGTLTSNSSWLVVSPSSGSVSRPFLDVDQPNVTVDPTNLQPGIYYGRILIDSKAAVNNPQLITVTVNVLPGGSPLPPEIYPTGVIFTGVAGVNPSSTDVMVQNSAANPTSYQSVPIGNGFSFLPTNAAQPTGKGTDVKVYPDFSKLSPGSTQHGGITFLFADGTLENVSVLIVIAPQGLTPNTVSDIEADGRTLTPRASGSCSSQPLQVVYRLLQNNFVAVVGQGTNVEAVVSDGCGNLVENPQTAKVIASFNQATVNMSHIGNGVWQGTWTPAATGTVAVIVQAILQNGASLAGGSSPALTGTVDAMPASVPAGNAAAVPLTSAVTHAASQASGLPIAPGELITVWGANLATSASSSSTLPLPTQSNGLQVLLGVTPLPILYTSSGQMNVQVPYSVPLNTQYQLSVVSGTGLSVPQTLTVAAAAPGIFTVNQAGTGQGVIVKSDGITLAQAGTPAAIGETVIIYCTGLGIVSPAAVEGVPPSAAANTVNPVTVTIGGANAPVGYAGVTPGFPGLYQVNAVVPSGVTTGDSVPVQIMIAGQTSQTSVTMSVH